MAVNKEELMESIENMTVLELSELVKALEERFGVSATAVAAAPAAGAAGDGAAAAEEEQTEFDVVLPADLLTRRRSRPADKRRPQGRSVLKCRSAQAPFVACYEELCYTPGAGSGPATNYLRFCLDLPGYQG